MRNFFIQTLTTTSDILDQQNPQPRLDSVFHINLVDPDQLIHIPDTNKGWWKGCFQEEKKAKSEHFQGKGNSQTLSKAISWKADQRKAKKNCKLETYEDISLSAKNHINDAADMVKLSSMKFVKDGISPS